MKKILALITPLILTIGTLTLNSAAETLEVSLEEKATKLNEVNGGNYSVSNEPMTMSELVDLLINNYGLDESYVNTMGDGDPETPDSAFFDFGGGSPDMTFMRGNLAYVIAKLYPISNDKIDNPDSWNHIGQTGYKDVDDAPFGYPGNKEAIYICRQSGLDMPQKSDTELGFEEPVTKAEFTAACYSALMLITVEEQTPESEPNVTESEANEAEPEINQAEPVITVNNETAETTNPQTGSSSDFTLYVCIELLAGGIILLTLMKERKDI